MTKEKFIDGFSRELSEMLKKSKSLTHVLGTLEMAKFFIMEQIQKGIEKENKWKK